VSINQQVLREFGDIGADTLRRYAAQIEYTAFWCIRMLPESEAIEAVIPEAVEDVLVIRANQHELHQVKTRDESRGPWTLAEVLPILCAQYHPSLPASIGTCAPGSLPERIIYEKYEATCRHPSYRRRAPDRGRRRRARAVEPGPDRQDIEGMADLRPRSRRHALHGSR
jgi:hypothetical protein